VEILVSTSIIDVGLRGEKLKGASIVNKGRVNGA
jgi:hypothetical protein